MLNKQLFTYKIVLSFYLLLCFAVPLFAQDKGETGKPIITTYNCIDIGLNSQTWDFVKDSRGIVYVGSSPGVFQFDGSTWRSIPTANKTHARSMAIDKNDRVYVGVSGDIGYLAPNNKGELWFKSLLDKLPDGCKTFSYIWTTNILKGEIYFQSFEGIFKFTPLKRSNNNTDKNGLPDWKIKVWKPDVRFNFSFCINNSYYVQQGGVGLMKMVNDSLILLPGGEQFADDRLQVMLPYNRDGKSLILVGTFNRGLFLFDGNSFEHFNCEADPFLRNNTLYKGKILNDGDYVFVTLNGGMIIMDKEGKIKLSLNKRTGLSSNSVTALFIDKGLIWMAPEGSISVVEYPSPITLFDESAGQVSLVQSMIRYKGTMYFSTTNGVFYLDRKTSTIKQLTGFIPGNNQSFQLKIVNDQLLVTYGTGLYRIDGPKVILIKEASGLSFIPNYIHQSLLDSNRIFVGMIDGICTFYLDKHSKWIYEGRISSINDYVGTIIETKPGVIWGSTDNNGALKLDFRGRSLSNPEVKRFSAEQGLPPGGTNMYKTSRKSYFIFWDGVYTYDDKNEKFVKDSLFSLAGQIDYANISMVEDKKGNLWFNAGNHVTYYRLQKDGSFIPENTFTSRLSNDIVVSIYPEENGTVWFGGGSNVYKFNQNSLNKYDEKFNTLIRKVVVGEDSVLFGGLGETGTKAIYSVDYSDNSVVFEFSATSMVDPSASEYQSMLEGFDEKWSLWKKDSYRNYTNLPAGDYTFKVKGKNLYLIESNEAAFSFTILPPWYRSWFAYSGYAIVLGLMVFGVDRLQRRRLTKKERERAEFREAKLRAESENERRKNIELLSEIGKEITATLDLDVIFYKLYEHVNQLADATIFGVGIYHPDKEEIEYRLAIEKGKRYPVYSRDIKDKNQFPVWCIENRKPVFINDVKLEYNKYIRQYKEPDRVLEDGTKAEEPSSIIYLPLISKDRLLGVITIQSFQKNAYTDYHLNILRNLATFTAIAIDNADAYKQLNTTLDELKSTQDKLVTQEKLASLGALNGGNCTRNQKSFKLCKQLCTVVKGIGNGTSGRI